MRQCSYLSADGGGVSAVDDADELRERANSYLEMAARLRSIRSDAPAIKDLEKIAAEMLARAEAIEQEKKEEKKDEP
jgi:hypothetical protein